LARNELECDDQNQDEGENRHDLGNRDHGVDEGGLLHAAQNCEVKGPDAYRSDGNGSDGVAVAEHRKERAECRFDQHPIGNVADATANPIAECRQKSGIVSKTGFRISVNTGIDFRLALGQHLEHAGERVHAARCDSPRDDGAEELCAEVGDGMKG